MLLKCSRSILAILITLVALPDVIAQDSLPDNWQRLSDTDFAYAVEPFCDRTDNRLRGPFDVRAVRQHAANLFLQYDLATAPLSDFPTIYRLFRAGWRDLSDAQIDAMGQAVASRQDDWSGRSYAENLSKVMLMDWVEVPFQWRSNDVISFVEAGGQYEDVPPNDFQDYARLAVRNPQIVKGSFTVRWEGLLTAPQTGQYTFFISPVNTSFVAGEDSLAQSMTVTLDGQKMISATPKEWNSSSAAVQLTAGEPLPVQIDFVVESPDLPKYAMHAMLSWEGPGIARTIIPADRLTVPDGQGNGLLATYSWTADGQDRSFVGVDDNIDFAWTSYDVVVSGDTSIKDDLLAIAWEKHTADDFFDSLIDANMNVRMHPWTIDPELSSPNLSSTQREAFLRLLIDRPELLDAYPSRRIVNLYRAYRFGATETALDMFGQWALRRASCECEVSQDLQFRGFDFENRKAFHRMAVSVTQELPAHSDRLQAEFLEMLDGTCCLPVAYTLGYSYLMRNRLDEWIALLDAKLDQETLTGDKRVNWLIARSHAQEIRLGTRNPYASVRDRPMDGRHLLDEALAVAEDPDVKLSVTKQIAVRYTATKQFDQARGVLDEAARSGSIERAATIAAWRASINRLDTEKAAAVAGSVVRTSRSYIKAMQRRRDRAAAAGDTDAVNRYDALIKATQQ